MTCDPILNEERGGSINSVVVFVIHSDIIRQKVAVSVVLGLDAHALRPLMVSVARLSLCWVRLPLQTLLAS